MHANSIATKLTTSRQRPSKKKTTNKLLRDKLTKKHKPDDEQKYDDEESQRKYKDRIRNLLSQSKTKQQKVEQRDIDDSDDDDDKEQDLTQEQQMDEYQRTKEALQNFKQSKPKRKHDISIDGPATELSNDILSYERFYPGRVLGNTFTITNKTDETIVIHMNFTREWLSTEYISHKLQEFQEVATEDEIEKPY